MKRDERFINFFDTAGGATPITSGLTVFSLSGFDRLACSNVKVTTQSYDRHRDSIAARRRTKAGSHDPILRRPNRGGSGVATVALRGAGRRRLVPIGASAFPGWRGDRPADLRSGA